MAESKKIKNTDIIENDLFGNAKKSANELKIVLGGLNDTLIETAKAQAKILQGSKNPTNSKDLNDLNKILTEAQKTRIALIAVKKQEQQLEREMLATAKAKAQADKQAVKDTQVTTSAYDALRKKYNDLSRAQIELSVRGREGGKVFKGIQDEALKLRAALDKAEQGAGRFQRNVGNYASGFNGLNNSVNQLTRELPAFAVSMNTGFLAISNNLPMFFDQLEKINKENSTLLKQGKPIESVFKQLGSAVFSFGSLLSIGVTLLTVFGGKIVETIASLFTQKNSLDNNIDALNSYNQAIKEAKQFQSDLQKQIDATTLSVLNQSKTLSDAETGALKALEDQLDNEKKAFEMRNEQIGKYITDLLINGDKEAKIKTTNSEKVISIENEKNGQIVRINKETGKIVGQYSAFYNKTSFSITEEFAKKRVDQIIKEYKITQNLIKNNYDAKIKDEIEKENERVRNEREKAAKKIKEVIDLNDRIIRQNIENETDTKERAINLTKDLERIAIKEVEAIKATYKQKQLLILAIQQDTYNKLIEIDDKYAQIEIDKINAKYEKILAEQDKNIAAIQKISLDNKDYNLFLLEEQYAEEKKLGDKANKQKLDDLQKQILEEKKLLIQKRADIEKEGKNITEQEAIQNKADIDKKKLRTEKQAENDLKVTKKYNEEITRLLLIEIDKRSEKEQDAFNRDLKKRAETIDIQRKLAEDGIENQLAFEEAQRDKTELKKREAEEKAQKEKEITQLVDAYFNALNARLQTKGTNPSTAAALALSDVLLAKGISKGIAQVAKDGNEDVQPLNGVGGQIGVDDIPFMLTRNEAVVTREANMKHKGVVKSLNDGTFEQKFQNKDNEKMITLLEEIKNKPIQQVNVEGITAIIESVYSNNRTDIIKHVIKPKRI